MIGRKVVSLPWNIYLHLDYNVRDFFFNQSIFEYLCYSYINYMLEFTISLEKNNI